MFDPDNHPRPQLVRERWMDLCGRWQFAYDDANLGLTQEWMTQSDPFDRTIIVPFPPESRASGIGDPAYHPFVWYRRTFWLPSDWQPHRLLVHFGAVDYRAQVWVNGHLVVEHEGGNTPFTAEISGALNHDVGDQILVVRVEDLPGDLTQPRGKQYWNLHPAEVWYGRTTGIWQPVWLEPVHDTYITNVRWTADLDRDMVDLRIALNAYPPGPFTVEVTLQLHGKELAHDTFRMNPTLGDQAPGAQKEIHREIAIALGPPSIHRDTFLLWSPRYPNLVDATIVLTVGPDTSDVVGSYFGLRTVGTAKGHFILNGYPKFLRMVLSQGYWPESHLAAPNAAALRRDVELIKELGFNGVRVHQKVEDPRFLYWCDKLGLLVWGEMANAYAFSPTAVERLTKEWIDVLRRDYSHPCLMTWVPINESWGVPNLARDPAQQAYVKALYYLTHALDPTRLVIGNDGWEHITSDILGVHDYVLQADTLRERYGTAQSLRQTVSEVQPFYRVITLPDFVTPESPFMLTECGGISLASDVSGSVFSYGTVPDRDAFLMKYDELISVIVESPSIAGFCYTQLTDVEQETNGLLYADRSFKCDPARLRSMTARFSRAVPGEILLARIESGADVSVARGVSDRDRAEAPA